MNSIFKILNLSEDEAIHFLNNPAIDINATKGGSGKTVLMYATSMCRDDIVRLLLERTDIDVFKKDRNGHDALYYAKRCIYEDVGIKMVRDIEEKMQQPIQSFRKTETARRRDNFWEDGNLKMQTFRETETARQWDWGNRKTNEEKLIFSITNLREEDIIPFINNTKDINATKGDSGKTPLMMAAIIGRDNIVRLLLERTDIDVFKKDRNGHDALYYAKRYKDEDTSLKMVGYIEEKMQEQMQEQMQTFWKTETARRLPSNVGNIIASKLFGKSMIGVISNTIS